MNLEKIKWAGLLPSLSVFSGELLGQRISLIAMGDFYEMRANISGEVYSKKVEKAYLSIAEKKEIIRDELSRHA